MNAKLTRPRRPNGQRDRRYRMTTVRCAHPGRMIVVTFCAETIGIALSRQEALDIAAGHQVLDPGQAAGQPGAP